MLTDKELQSLRNLGNEAEAAADEIDRLRSRVMELAALVPIAEANERERCAKACEQLHELQRCTIVAAEHYADCAATIRALGTTRGPMLRDHENSAWLEAEKQRMRDDPACALKSLQDACIVGADGKLTNRFGGEA